MGVTLFNLVDLRRLAFGGNSLKTRAKRKCEHFLFLRFNVNPRKSENILN